MDYKQKEAKAFTAFVYSFYFSWIHATICPFGKNTLPNFVFLKSVRARIKIYNVLTLRHMYVLSGQKQNYFGDEQLTALAFAFERKSFLSLCLVMQRSRSLVIDIHSSKREFHPSKCINTDTSEGSISMIRAVYLKKVNTMFMLDFSIEQPKSLAYSLHIHTNA